MREDIKIDFKMNIINDGQNYEVQFNEDGKRYYKNNKIYIMFTEPSMNNQKSNQLTLICDDDEIVIIRNGEVKMRQNYIENCYTKGYYNNQYIQSEITTYTRKYQYTDQMISLEYDIVNDDDIIGNYEMKVNIKGDG